MEAKSKLRDTEHFSHISIVHDKPKWQRQHEANLRHWVLINCLLEVTPYAQQMINMDGRIMVVGNEVKTQFVAEVKVEDMGVGEVVTDVDEVKAQIGMQSVDGAAVFGT